MEVKREVVLPAERDEVWSALTDPERLQDWFANDVELDLEPGGEGVFRWDDSGGGTRVVVTETLTGDGAVAEWSSALELRSLAYAYA